MPALESDRRLMSSLANLPELVGFFSYSRDDDIGSHGALSALRERIQHELRAQLGRSFKSFRLWQDKEAIAPGRLWASEITTGIAQSAFFVPIITPTVVKSPSCKFELDSFLAREQTLGRTDLVFPILYLSVPGLEDEVQRLNDPVLSVIAKRQYVDWRELRYEDINATEVKKAVARFCSHIVEALAKPWVSPEERRREEEAEARHKAEEAKRQQDEERRRLIAAEVGRQRVEDEAAAKRETEERARQAVAADAERQRQELEAAATREAGEKAHHEKNASAAERRGREVETKKTEEPRAEKPERINDGAKPLLAIPAVHYFSGAYLLLICGFSFLLDAVLLVLIIKDSSAPGAVYFLDLAFWLISLAGLGAGFGTMKAKGWARAVGLVVCLIGMAAAAFFAFVDLFLVPRQQSLGTIAEVSTCVIALSSGGCAFFYIFGWKPLSWLASRIPENTPAFVIFILVVGMLPFGFFPALDRYGSPVYNNLAPWLTASIGVIALISAYSLVSFRRQFGATKIAANSRSQP